MKYLILLLTCFLLGYSTSVSAQSDSLNSYVLGGYLIMPIEFPLINTNQVDAVLNQWGYPSVDYPRAAVGIGLQYYTNGVITTFSFNKTTRTTEENTFVREVEYRATSFNLGFDLTRSYWHSVYPFIGFKGSGLNYLYREKVSDQLSFENYLKGNLQYREMTFSRAHLDLGLGISTQWFYLINFRAGYLVPLERVRWNINNSQDVLQNAPVLQNNVYFTLTIGLGGISGNRRSRQSTPPVPQAERPQMANNSGLFKLASLPLPTQK